MLSKYYFLDLYEDLVSNQLETSLYVESWLNGPNDLLSNCSSKFSVIFYLYMFKKSNINSALMTLT